MAQRAEGGDVEHVLVVGLCVHTLVVRTTAQS